MNEATISVFGDIDQTELLAFVRNVTGADDPDVDIIVDLGVPIPDPDPTYAGILLFDGLDIDNAVVASAASIAARWPNVRLQVLDQLGRDVSFGPEDAVSVPRPRVPNKHTVVLDILPSVFDAIELVAKEHGNSVTEELQKWVEERAAIS